MSIEKGANVEGVAHVAQWPLCFDSPPTGSFRPPRGNSDFRKDLSRNRERWIGDDGRP